MTLDTNELEEAEDIPIISAPDALENPGEADAFGGTIFLVLTIRLSILS
jgi:hypothetical protein